MMTAEERLLNLLFTEPEQKKDIHMLTEKERAKCSDGYNTAIEIIVGNFAVTGGTLEERCAITDSDVNMKETLKQTTVSEILKVTEEGEDVALYIFEDLIMVLSDLRYESNVERTFCLPIETDLSMLNGTDNIEVIDLR